jgi:hypothetical protein
VIRKCAREKKVANCAYCADYPCQKLSAFLAQAPEAKATLENGLLILILGFSIMLISSPDGIGALFTTTMFDDTFVIATLIALTPLAILHFKDGSRTRSLEEALPNFFRDVAGMNDSGMTLPNAVHIVSPDAGVAPSPVTADEVEAALAGQVALILEGGDAGRAWRRRFWT